MNDAESKVINYYNHCYRNYRTYWKTDRNLSIHYGFYDTNHTTHDDAVVNMNRVLATIANIKSEDYVLDVGCGIGGSVIWLAKNLGAQACGINIHAMQIKIAEEAARKNNVANLAQFSVRNFLKTGFPNETFDVVWDLESICHTEHKRDFVLEARRVLKEGGRLIIADYFLKSKNFSEGEKRHLDRWFDGWAIPNLITKEELQIYLRELGFKKILFKEITENVTPSSIRMFIPSSLVYPFVSLLKLTGIRTETQIKHIIASYCQYRALKKDLWLHGIFYAEK